MRSEALALGVILTLIPAVPAAQTAPLQDKLRLAVEKLDQGDSFGALVDLERLLAADDTYGPAYVAHGRVLAAMGDDLGARASFERATELDPGNGELHFTVAVMSLRIADFETGWEHCVAAAQAGYAPREIDQLVGRLGNNSDAPEDLDARLDAPRVLVTRRHDETGVRSERLERLWLQLRTGLLQAPLVALVQHAALARFEVSIGAAADGSGFEVTLVGRSHSEPLYRGAIMVDGDSSDADADQQMMDRVTEIEAWLAQPHGGPGA